jgi:hypothetical protein
VAAFATNVGPGEVQIKDGALKIPSQTYVNNGLPGPNPWGFLINFDAPYVYTGGDLCFTARHDGSVEAGALFLDSLLAATEESGYGAQSSSNLVARFLAALGMTHEESSE